MKTPYIAFSLLLLLASPVFADDQPLPPLPCGSGFDRGAELTVRGKSPLGEGATLVIYPDAVAVKMPPDHVAYIAHIGKSDFVAFEGNSKKVNETGWRIGGDLWNKISLKKNGDELVLSRKDDPKADVVRVKLPRLGVSGSSGKPLFEQSETSVASGGATLYYVSRIPREQEDAANDFMVKLGKRAEKLARETPSRAIAPVSAHVDLSEGHSSKVRTGCGDQATDLTAQNADDAAAPAPSVAGD